MGHAEPPRAARKTRGDDAGAVRPDDGNSAAGAVDQQAHYAGRSGHHDREYDGDDLQRRRHPAEFRGRKGGAPRLHRKTQRPVQGDLRYAMKITRLVPTPDGGSKFVEVDIPINDASTDAFGNTVHRSAILPAQSAMVTEMPEGLYQHWHPASRRQLLFVLSGTLEVETSDGTKHRCSSGAGFLADDVGSRGHRTRTIGCSGRVLFVHLPPQANLRA